MHVKDDKIRVMEPWTFKDVRAVSGAMPHGLCSLRAFSALELEQWNK